MGGYIKIEDAAMAFSIHSPYRYEDCLNDLISSIADGAIELADVAPVVHRRWEEIRDPYGKLEGWLCECGREVMIKDDFCPKCGAKMDGKVV